MSDCVTGMLDAEQRNRRASARIRCPVCEQNLTGVLDHMRAKHPVEHTKLMIVIEAVRAIVQDAPVSSRILRTAVEIVDLK